MPPIRRCIRQHLAQVGWRGPVTVSAFSLPDEDGEAWLRIERARGQPWVRRKTRRKAALKSPRLSRGKSSVFDFEDVFDVSALASPRLV